ncbi:hypothetical protein CANARDRAFT_204309 [[Candida] arabinofermentans NRRL YB-2248]|uniref:CCA tRNA nucleotidyltransferase, mitochondrial n=1 Tax=[Candida] arabinofermentans NRRL YB-2248 TaxID=983967 RepID=A0A1E4STK8_9ASCO|nr:hypothetical protein CANARDRAFT_204309 [[Candida] arabinofermentans NRRL YB-2248]
MKQCYKPITLNTNIQLDETETKIINLLNEYTDKYNQTTTTQPLTLRITGGWVRDKLLNLKSHDIDIGIDNLSGLEFVHNLKEYITIEKYENVFQNQYLIAKNPEKSKHLETCTVKLYNLDIDFVNLRSETYTESSRIPIIEKGTPLQDSFRRDATLNSMFYNLKTCKIEDFTKLGLKDLQNGLLRTPLDPLMTFKDDPLRCLRLIRFASNYGFKIDDLALNCMKLKEIKLKLNEKISKERINVEFKKILVGSNPIYGLKLINDVGFYQLFGFDDVEFALNDISFKLSTILNEFNNDITINQIELSDNEICIYYLSLILRDCGDLKVKFGKKDMYKSSIIVLENLKFPLKTSELVGLIVGNLQDMDFNDIYKLSRSELAFKYIIPYEENWKLNLLIHLTIQCLKGNDNAITQFKEFVDTIHSLQLESIYKTKLLINGNELLKIMNKKPGPWLKEINQNLFKWQLDNPTKTKQEAIEYLYNLI